MNIVEHCKKELEDSKYINCTLICYKIVFVTPAGAKKGILNGCLSNIRPIDQLKIEFHHYIAQSANYRK